ncbi:MAG: RagB/SusD family nutrient uptake outer membrane protein [Bacteroidales bacterium]|nr:RagB/SusD family nutrient uptake outer membrane protein [Bacteroidales bacterium]
MKKTIYIFIAVVALAALTLTGCIKETFPMNAYATTEQIGASASALEASVNGIPSQMAQGYLIYGYQAYEYDMGFPALMLEWSEALGDLYPLGNPDYDHYQSWNTCLSMGPSTARTYVPYVTLYMFAKSANDIIGAVDIEDEDTSDEMKGYAGIAYATRAFTYYNLLTMYEPVENVYTDVSNILGLTVPIVTDETTGEEGMDNPRATHDDLVELILSDCDKAEECFANWTPSSRLFPGLAVAYAVKARTYMWDEQWANAATYARKAIDESGAPMTKAQLTDVNTAFNTATPGWLWYIHYDAENMGNLCNWIGWICAEADWGYASLTGPGIDKSLYDKISDTDYRKTQFVDPDKYDYYDYESVVTDWDFIAECPDYTSLKFRCVGGDWENYTVGGIADVPVIRVEEMYLIEAEAKGRSQSVSAGVSALNEFMQSYRDPSYNCTAASVDDLASAVLDQMRIEFWGEGTAFATAKRLKPDVIQSYAGTNAPGDSFLLNLHGIKPNWNFCIPDSEVQANKGLIGFESPDPSQPVLTPCAEGEWGTSTSSN